MQITNEDLKRIIKEELDAVLSEKEGKKDACYHKVKSRYDVWPSAYASGALVKCRKVGAKNWGNSKKEGIEEEFQKHDMYDPETGEKHKANVEADHTDMAGKGFVHVDPDKLRDILDDEGGAAGLDPMVKGTKSSEEEIEKALDKMSDVGKHKKGDYIKDDDKEVDIVKEAKNCGCGQDPCKTYGEANLAEKKLTKRDKQQKEKFVKGMKKNKKGFKKDYGKDAESVMYATATKMAQKKK